MKHVSFFYFFLFCTFPKEHIWWGDKSIQEPITLQDLELKDQKNQETASELYFSEQHMYKNWDYRCLVPYSHKDPTKWKTYEMHDYRRAFNEETLKKVDQYKYDKYFYNMVDPKVLKYYTKSTKSMKRAWEKSYGFPYTTYNSYGNANANANVTKCFQKCAHYVSNPIYTKSFR